MSTKLKISSDELLALVEESMFGMSDSGVCLSCGEVTDGVEPDARGYPCPSCDKPAVMGAEEILLHII